MRALLSEPRCQSATSFDRESASHRSRRDSASPIHRRSTGTRTTQSFTLGLGILNFSTHIETAGLSLVVAAVAVLVADVVIDGLRDDPGVMKTLKDAYDEAYKQEVETPETRTAFKLGMLRTDIERLTRQLDA